MKQLFRGGGASPAKSVSYIENLDYYTTDFVSGCHCSIFLYMLKYDVSRIPDFTYGDIVDWDNFTDTYGGFSPESNAGIESIYGSMANSMKMFPFGRFKIYGDSSKIYCIQAADGNDSRVPVFSHFFILTKNAFNTYDICFYGFEKFKNSQKPDCYVENYKFISETDFELQRFYLKDPADTIEGCIEKIKTSPEYKGLFYQDFKNNKLSTYGNFTANGGNTEEPRYIFANFTTKEFADRCFGYSYYGKLGNSYKGEIVYLTRDNGTTEYNRDCIESEQPLTIKRGYSVNEQSLNTELDRIKNTYHAKCLTSFPSNTIEVFTQLDSYKPYDN